MKVLLAMGVPGRDRFGDGDLRRAGATEVVRPAPGETLVDAVARAGADLVIVDMARPDRDSLDAIRHLSRDLPRPVVMFVDADDSAFMEEAIAAGVSSYNVVGLAPPDVKPIVRAAVALFRRYQQMESRLQVAESDRQDRDRVARAKALLMRRHHCAEPQAYARLRRMAMDTGRRISDVAAGLLAAAQEGPDDERD